MLHLITFGLENFALRYANWYPRGDIRKKYSFEMSLSTDSFPQNFRRPTAHRVPHKFCKGFIYTLVFCRMNHERPNERV